jgi:hypothetical protein
MIKELKYLFFIIVISIFVFLTLKYYFSDINKRNSYRSLKEINEKIFYYSKNLFLLKSDTDNIVEYVERTSKNKKKNYNFWKLIDINE